MILPISGSFPAPNKRVYTGLANTIIPIAAGTVIATTNTFVLVKCLYNSFVFPAVSFRHLWYERHTKAVATDTGISTTI